MIKFISGSGDNYLRSITPAYDIYFSCHWEAVGEINGKINRLNAILDAERISVKNDFCSENAVVAFYFRYRNLVNGNEFISATDSFLCELHATGAVEFAPQWGTLVEESRDAYFLAVPPPLPNTAIGEKVVVMLCDSVVTENYLHYARRSVSTGDYTQHFYNGSTKLISYDEAKRLSVRKTTVTCKVLSY